MIDRNLVILAGGISSRMKKPAAGPLDERLLSDVQEKVKTMIGVGRERRPLLDYLLYNAQQAGYRDIVVVVSGFDRSVREHYGPADSGNSYHGLSISYAVQSIPPGRTKPLGTADALLRALYARPDWEGKKFTVCNSDNLYSARALALLLETDADAAMIDYDREALQCDADRVRQFAVLKEDGEGRLEEIIEKPSPEQVARVREAGGRVGVSMNIFRFLYDRILPFLESVPLHPARLEKELPVAVMLMIGEHPGSMIAIPLAEHVPDLTSRDDIHRVREYLEREYPDDLWTQKNRLH
jgi:glucose-1-phosphate adenylyltransferase